ncbi:MAG: SurA N-terminal domain-containing protein [Synergistaceae bacterium]|nr:SurA N-terminal domain-containing protein [Synergistaceae bacterium]
MMKFLRTQMKWIMAVIVVAFLLSTFLMYETRGTRRSPSRNPDGTMTDYEVAQINGRSLMRSELEQRLRNYLSTYSTRSMTSIDMPAIYRSVLNQAILESQTAKEVEEKGIRVSDAEADQAMKNYADTYFPTREAFYQVLANSGLKPEDYKRSLARQIAAERLMREAIGNVTVSEDKAVEFYDTMKGILYSRPEGFNIHMADFNTIAEAEEFRAKISGGESWDILASGDIKGVINITKSPVMLPTSALTTGTLSTLDSLDVGTVSPVFEVASGDYAVAMKTSHVDAGTVPYDDVSEDIRILLTQQEERSRLAAYEESLMKKAAVVINDEELFASPAADEDENSGDILPIMNLEENTSNEPEPEDTPEVVEEVSNDEPEDTQEVVEAVSEDKPEEVPAVSDSMIRDEPEEAESSDTPLEAPIVTAAEEDSTDETPAEVSSSDEAEETPKTDEQTEIESAKSEDVKAAEVPESDDTPSEPEEVIAKSEDIPLQAEITESKDEAKPETVSSDK